MFWVAATARSSESGIECAGVEKGLYGIPCVVAQVAQSRSTPRPVIVLVAMSGMIVSISEERKGGVGG